jgi:hypothetical protein
VGLAEGDMTVRYLRGPRHNEERVAVLLDLGLPMGVRRVLDRQRMQMELGRDTLQQFFVGFVQADPDDVPLLLRPSFRFLDRDVGDAPPPGVDARRHNAQFVRGRMVRLRRIFDTS